MYFPRVVGAYHQISQGLVLAPWFALGRELQAGACRTDLFLSRQQKSLPTQSPAWGIVQSVVQQGDADGAEPELLMVRKSVCHAGHYAATFPDHVESMWAD